ncbi:RDD family protein [Pseudomonas citronellolis]|uniref:RDD family protein n=1 Tax=Pseudomonas citronellolis TaxID=53408 RepID=UPI0023E3579F|nr:RDD family protein [Pseudomonas citronellolis]MDF3935980.1 RDD family protein [Pseudomonas citronellolis]
MPSNQPKILASIVRRLAAKAIDGAIAIAIFLLASFVAKLLSANLAWVSPDAGLFLGMPLALGYFLLGDALPNGQSLGKRLLHIRVIDRKSGRSCRPGQALTRNASAFLLLDSMWIFMAGRSRLGDMHAATAVLQTDKLATNVRSLADIFEAGDAELEPSPMRVEVVTLVDDGRQREG